MNLLLQKATVNQKSTILITGSKSETNRLLLLQALYPNIIIENASASNDAEVMQKALTSNNDIIDIDHAGTAMRFLTAYFAIQEGNTIVLTGSSRMKLRPIQILVTALLQLGAQIEYLEKDGFPPIKITGKKLIHNTVTLPANVSSQYISALLLIAPKLQSGIELTLVGQITSVPYIKMTLELLKRIGATTSFKENTIVVLPPPHPDSYRDATPHIQSVESDWSSASYYYSIVALSKIGTQITLSNYKAKSLQGDSRLVTIYKKFGVATVFNSDNSITITKTQNLEVATLKFALNTAPDIAQTIAVTCFGLGFGCRLTGLHTLKIKETDRLEALKNELSKLGASISVTNDSLTLAPSSKINEKVTIKTYQDHRMAMAFAPLALKTKIIIEHAEVVSKSYPTFWKDLGSVGFEIATV
jgi:3-phosphoshikimate 1-carboxyvinyltransferase